MFYPAAVRSFASDNTFPPHRIFVNRNLDLKCVGGVVFDLQIQPAFRHRRVNSLGNAGRIAVKVDSMCMLFCNSRRSILPIISLLSVICFIKEQIHAPVSIILLDKSMDCFNKKLIDF